MKKIRILKIGGFAILALVAIGALVMWLWNWLIPSLFSGPVITYFQALGLLLLSRILLRGFGHSHNRMCSGSKFGQMREKWNTMSPEEKDKLRDLWKIRCRTFDSCGPNEQEANEEPLSK